MVVVLVNGGRQVGRVEAAIGRLSSIEARLDRVPVLDTKIGMLEEGYAASFERMRSDHRQLAQRVDRMRDRFPTGHDE